MKNYICKRTNNGGVILIKIDDLNGLNFKPKNSKQYGITVNKMIVIEPKLVRQLLIKSTKRKLDKFIYLIANISDDDDSTDSTLREALNDLTRYRNIVEYKYKKYLDNKYQEKLIAKIDILEGELKKKIIYGDNEKALNKIYRDMYERMFYNSNIYDYEEENRKTR